MKRVYKYGGGFTLIEALVGSLVLSLGAVVVCSLSSRCLHNNKIGMEYEQAYRLLDECLEKAQVSDLPKLADKGSIEGDFGNRCLGYSYSLTAKEADRSGLYHVEAKVHWVESGSGYEVSAVTLLYDFVSDRDNSNVYNGSGMER